MNALDSLPHFLPEICLISGAFLLLVLDFFISNKKILGWTALFVLMAAASLCEFPKESIKLFFGYFQLDSLTYYFRFVAMAVVAISILLSLTYRPLKHHEGEYYSLFLFLTVGLTLMASSVNLLMIFLGIEFVSILSYLMVGFLKNDARSKEASMKYLLFGSFSSGMMLFGMSLLFGASGSLELPVIQQRLLFEPYFPLIFVASLLFLAGIAFKISMAPFHFWAPDVYEGAPTPFTAFLTVGPKALGFAVLIRSFLMIFPWFGMKWGYLIALLSMITMTIGNVTAISQHNIKRLLGYSSIAQAGYILMGIASVSETGLISVLIYVLVYSVTNLGAFTVVIAVSNHLENDEIESYRGLSERSPFLAAALTIFLLSLAGIPPLAGFIGKFFVFSSAMEAGLFDLALVAALNSAVAGYYYFKIIKAMYLMPASDRSPIPNAAPLLIGLGITLIGTIVIGVYPAVFIEYIQTMLFV